MTIHIPYGVTAILDNGFRVPCVVLPDGSTRDGTAKYKITAEIDWREHKIVAIEVKHWPVGTALALDYPSSTGEAMAYANNIEWRDLTGVAE